MEQLLRFQRIFCAGMFNLFEPIKARRMKNDRILNKTNEEALHGDWIIVGSDVSNAMVEYRKECQRNF